MSSKKVYRPSSDQIATLSFYKNNIVHLFILHSLICESVKFVKKASEEEITDLIKMVFPIFAKEFHLKSQIVNSETVHQAIQLLKNKHILDFDNEGNVIHPVEKNRNYDNYVSLTNLCEPVLKRFYIVMSLMWKGEAIGREDLKAKCKNLAEELEKIEGWPYPEFSDKAKFDNFLYMMIETRYFKENNEGNLFASKITKRAKNLYEKFFDNEFLSFIENKIN